MKSPESQEWETRGPVVLKKLGQIRSKPSLVTVDAPGSTSGPE